MQCIPRVQNEGVRRKGKENRESTNSLAHDRQGSNWLFCVFLDRGEKIFAVPYSLSQRNHRLQLRPATSRQVDCRQWETNPEKGNNRIDKRIRCLDAIKHSLLVLAVPG